jgi:hypothetical protein
MGALELSGARRSFIARGGPHSAVLPVQTQNRFMKQRNPARLVLSAALGLALSSAVHAQFVTTNLDESSTFGAPTGGTNFIVTKNGVLNATTAASTGTSNNPPAQFTITDTPLLGTQTTSLLTGTLTTMNITLSDAINATNMLSSIPLTVSYDFDNSGGIDLTQTYTVALTPFTLGAFSGVSYSILPNEITGAVTISGITYQYASVVSNSAGSLFDGSATTAAIQFQFLAVAVPEPSTYALAGVLVLGAIVLVRHRSLSAATSGLAA